MLTSFQVLNWYSSLQDQSYRCGCDCFIPCFPATDLPHFQIKGDNKGIGKFLIHPYPGPIGYQDNIISESCEVNGETISYITFAGSASASYAPGEYYYSIAVDGVTWYSDVFCIKQNNCFKQKLTWSSCKSNIACYEGVFDQVLYLEDTKQGAPTFEETINGKENANGEFTSSYGRMDQYDNLFFVGVCHVNAALKGMTFHDDIILTDLRTNIDTQLSSVTVTDPTDECYFGITLSYKAGESLETEGCCESDFDGSPYEDNCETTTDPGEPCPDDFTATLLPDGNGNVVAMAQNAPGPVTAYNLYVNGQPNGQGQSINLTSYGTYEVRIVSEGCTAIATYVYNDPCVNFSADIVCNGLKIEGTISGIPSGDTATISICDSDGVAVGNSFPFAAPEAGIYTIKITTESGCSFLANKQVGEDVCDWDFTLGKSSTGALVPDWITECESPTYRWIQITNANNEVQVGTGSSYTPTETGYYILEISCDGCVKRRGYMCQVVTEPECIPIEIKNWDEMPSPTLEFPDDPIKVEIEGVVKTCETPDAGPDVTKPIPPRE